MTRDSTALDPEVGNTLPRVLFVDDDQNFLAGLRRSLAAQRRLWRIEYTADPLDALQMLAEEPETVVVTDWNMSPMTGPELIEQVRAAQTLETGRPYVILLTGRSSTDEVSEGLERGADDFASKPIGPRELVARIRVGLRLLEAERALRSANARLSAMATTDVLTGCWNRRHGTNVLQAELQRTERDLQSLAVMLVDVDYFKQINDQYGHSAGDEVLTAVSQRLAQACRSYDSIVRWGGYDFLVICPFRREPADGSFADRVVATVAGQPVELTTGGEAPISCSGGVAIVESGTRLTADAFLESADRALYEAKEAGRNCARSSGVIQGAPGTAGALERG